MAGELTFEQRRKQNIADNKRILAEIGLINPYQNLQKLTLKKSGLKRKATNELPRHRKRPLLEENVDHSKHGSVMGTRRRSARLQGSTPSHDVSDYLEDYEEGEDDEENRFRRVEKNRPNKYGAIEGVEVGASWYTRMECCRDGIHRPTVAGIHAGPDGAYSIALSGGYDDNVDYGECFTYTGEGGRDLKGTKTNPKNLRTAPQSKNQTLTRGNLALSRNVETGQPVRVIRGYKLNTVFAPEEGYRYDGLYTVEKAWYTVGLSGFMVWKFALKRCKDQAPPPWEFTEEMKQDQHDKSFEKDEAGKLKEDTKGGAEEDKESEESEENSEENMKDLQKNETEEVNEDSKDDVESVKDDAAKAEVLDEDSKDVIKISNDVATKVVASNGVALDDAVKVKEFNGDKNDKVTESSETAENSEENAVECNDKNTA